MPPGDPENATPHKRTTARAPPGDSLLNEGKKKIPQVLKRQRLT